MTKILLPNESLSVYDAAAETWTTATVVASSVFNDDGPVIQVLLVLLPDSPYFQVAVYNPDEGMVAAEYGPRVFNIGEAVQSYEDMGGDVG